MIILRSRQQRGRAGLGLTTLLLLTISLLLPGLARAATVTLAEYRQTLTEVAAALKRAEGQSKGAASTTVAPARSQLAAIGAVALADGSSFTPDNSLLLAALADPPTDLAPLEREVTALVAALGTTAVGPADGQLARLGEVLNDRRYQYGKPDRPRDFLDGVVDFFQGIINWYQRLDRPVRAFGTAAGLGLLAAAFAWLATRGTRLSVRVRRLWIVGSGGAVFLLTLFYMLVLQAEDGRQSINLLGPWALLGLAVVLLAIILAFVTYSGRLLSSAQSEAAVLADEQQMTSQQSSSRASVEAGQGNYRDAIRYLYLTTLILLDERGLLRYDRSLTNREYLLRLAREGQLSDLLTPIVETFDRTWYGHSIPDAAEYQRYAGLVEQVRTVAQVGLPALAGQAAR